MKILAASLSILALCACTPAQEGQTEIAEPPAAELRAEEDNLRATQEALLDRYFEVYVEAMLTLYDDDIIGVLYPTTLFGRGIEAARPGIEGDFAGRPDAWADMPYRYRIAADKWATYGESVNGAERTPLLIVFDLDAAGEKIEATYTQIAFASFIEGPSVSEPTQGMTAGFDRLFSALKAGDFAAAAEEIATDAGLYAYPPANLADHQPVIAGASDVASVLAFKWGEGAWRDDAFVSRYMQYVFVAIPGAVPGKGLDRAALFTFGADPDAPTYEKITRVDVMGPSGG
jgi:hypothetical protein